MAHSILEVIFRIRFLLMILTATRRRVEVQIPSLTFPVRPEIRLNGYKASKNAPFPITSPRAYGPMILTELMGLYTISPESMYWIKLDSECLWHIIKYS